MSKLTIYIQKGAFSLQALEQIQEYTNKSNKDCFELTVAPVKSARSAAQNKFYWKAIIGGFMDIRGAISNDKTDFCKWGKEDFHEAMKEKLLRGKNLTTGRVYTRSTTSLSVEEFSEYIENCIDILVRLGGVIMDKHNGLYREAMGA